MIKKAILSIILIIIISIFLLVGGYYYEYNISYNMVPINLSKAGSVSTTLVKINRDDRYRFNLRFQFDKNGKKDLRDIPVYMELIRFLSGYPNSRSGAIIPIKLMIYKLENRKKIPVYDRSYDTKGLRSSDDDAVYRQITIFRLKSGRYAVRIENLKDFPDLPKSTVTLDIERFFVK